MASSSAAMAASAAGSAESVQSSALNDDDESASALRSGKSRRRSRVVPVGTFHHSATLTPSQTDPDINAIFHTFVNEDDGQRFFRCTTCGDEFTRPYSARRHANVHLKHAAISCEICAVRLTGPLSLAAHLAENHKDLKTPRTRSGRVTMQPPPSTRTSRSRGSSVKDTSNNNNNNKKLSSESVTMLLDPPPASTKASKRDRNSNNRTSSKRKIVEDGGATDEVERKKEAAAVMIEPAEDPKPAPTDPQATVKSKKEAEAGVIKPAKDPKPASIDPPATVECKKEAEAVMIESAKDPMAAPADPPATVEKKKEAEAVMIEPAKDPKPASIDPPASVECKKEAEAVMIEPTKDPKTAPADPPATQERRSSRIQMRLALEASAVEEERTSTRPRKDTPPPIYPSNSEKMKEIKESIARRAQSAITLVPKEELLQPDEEEMPQLQQENAQLQPDEMQLVQQEQLQPKETVHRPDIIIEGVVKGTGKKRSSRVGNSARASSSRESVVVVVPKRAAAAPAAPRVRRTHPVYPAAAAASAAERDNHGPSPQPRHFLRPPHRTSPSSAMIMSPTAMTCLPPGVVGRGVAPSCTSSSSPSSHYPRLDSLCGPPVHQHQRRLSAPLDRLYPAPLSELFLTTIYDPVWMMRQIGEDEKQWLAQYGHTHLMLPDRMHRTETMIEKCMKALKDTSLPLPPLLPLLPTPCRLLQETSCDPLTNVLESLPRIPVEPFFRSHRVLTVPQPKYTSANEGVRHHMAEKKYLRSEDMNKKWWEVRTFPSFDGLATPGPHAPLPTSARPTTVALASTPVTGPTAVTTVTYTMADHGTRRHAMKYTYVTSKKPIFSVHAWPPQPAPSPPGPATPYCTPATSSNHSTPCSVTAATTTATGDSSDQQQAHHRRPAAARRPGVAARAAFSAELKKRSAAATAPDEVEALVKRIKTSFSETFPGRPADRPLSNAQRAQAALMQQTMYSVEGYCTGDVLQQQQSAAYNIAIPPRPARREEITIDEDGTTFTVL